jgi:glycosyltransferase involved in cell wall biosynthesis
MEAMACGLPAIATDWGGHQEFVHPGIAYPLRIARTVPAVAKCPYYEGFSWAEPDPEHLRHLLRHVYENRDEAKHVGAAAAREMAARWSWDRTAGRIVERLEALR